LINLPFRNTQCPFSSFLIWEIISNKEAAKRAPLYQKKQSKANSSMMASRMLSEEESGKVEIQVIYF